MEANLSTDGNIKVHWYLSLLHNKHKQDYEKNYPSLKPPTFSINFGKKYMKVIRDDHTQKSVHCFIDYEGNLYKAATWKQPAKGVRGHITSNDPPIFSKDFYNIKV